MRMMRPIVILAGLLLAVSCSTAAPPAPEVEHADFLDAAAPSVEELVGSFLEALEARDAERLSRLSLDRDEFEAVVWPELPANRPETNLSPDFVWEQYDMRSRAYRARLLDALGGQSFQLEKIEFKGKPRRYERFVIHDDPVLTLVAEDESREERLLFGAIIEHEGHYKIYGYSTD